VTVEEEETEEEEEMVYTREGARVRAAIEGKRL